MADGLAIILLVARIAQSLLHIGPTQTEFVAGVRFGFYAIQIACMILGGDYCFSKFPIAASVSSQHARDPSPGASPRS